MSDGDIVNVVDPIAARYGVPTFVWETVAEVESSFNPRATHHEADGSVSYGLFQLNTRGQLGTLSPGDAMDPAKNAEAAMPAIAKAWKSLSKGVGGPNLVNGTQDPGNYAWWYRFAILSGHPGADSGGANSATQNEAHLLQNEAVQLSAHPLPKSTSGNTNQPTRQPPDTSQIADPFGIGAILNSWLQGLIAPFQSGAIKVGIFLLALVVIAAGLWAISQNTGDK